MAEIKNTSNAYVKNEESANKHLSLALLFTVGLLLLAELGYIFKFFEVARDTYVLTIIALPIVALLLCTPMMFIKTERLKTPRFKYYVLFLFTFAIGVLNIVMPKHAILGWGVCIALTGHYYNPKVCRIMFVVVLVEMAICIFGGTFIGEFDANLLSGELEEETEMIHSFILPDVYPDSIAGRWNYTMALLAQGENRFLKIYANYYLGRALFVTLIYVVMVFVNKRTHDLLRNEIAVSNQVERNQTELEVAKQIQMNTLPSETISSKDVDIVAELKAAKEVGGDLYDYMDIDEDHVAILVGDVSGKGVPAAMFMMKTITSFRDFAPSNLSPSSILKQINTSIYKGNQANMFVTCFLAILNKKDGKLVYANAGHNPPLIGSDGHYSYLKCKSGLLLGMFEQTFVVDEEVMLKPGDSIIVYTDGVTEARDEAGGFYGEKRLLEISNKRDYSSLVELHHYIKESINGFVQNAPQSDDITLLTLKYRGGDYCYSEKEFVAEKENILAMLGMINDFGEENAFPDDFKNKLVIVGDELLSNIINHGYEGKEGKIFLSLLFDRTSNEFVLKIIDQAKPFNQLEVNNPDVGTEHMMDKVGGLGIFIVKNIMTEYAYDYINGKNILVLKKRF